MEKLSIGEYTIPEGIEAVIENGKIILREKESEDERMWNKILNHFDWSFKGPYLTHEECDEIKAFLEKKKEQYKCPEYCVKSNCTDCSIYEKQKEQKLTGINENPVKWNDEDEGALIGLLNILSGKKLQADDLKWLSFKLKSWAKLLRSQPKQELSIEKAIQWFDDTFYFLDNSSGRGRDCEITTHDFDSLEEMYNSFRKAVIVDSPFYWKPSEEQLVALWNTLHPDDPYYVDLSSLYDDLKKLLR